MVACLTTPRMLATILGPDGGWCSGWVLWCPVGIVIGTVAGTVLFARQECPLLRNGKVRPLVRMKERLPSAGAILVDSLHSDGLMQVAAALIVTGPTLASLSSEDRICWFVKQRVNTFIGALQEWITHDPKLTRRRQKLSVALHIALGAAGGVMLVSAGPRMTSLMFGGSFDAGPDLPLSYNSPFAMSAGSAIAKHVLAVGRCGRDVLWITCLGSVVLVRGVVPLARLYGAPGDALCYASMECAVTTCQVAAVTRRS